MLDLIDLVWFGQYIPGTNRTSIYKPPKRKTANEIKAGKKTNQLFLLMRLTMTLTIVSFSSVRLSAIIRVRATRVLSAMRLEPSSL